jgi:hypothetical protein
MDPVTVIAVAKGIFDFFHNKDKEKNNVIAAHQRYNDFYNSPQVQIQYAAIREYWDKHGLQAKAEAMGRPNMLEELLTPRAFDDKNPAYKIPGAGGKLVDDLTGAVANEYKSRQTRTPEFAGPPASDVMGGASLSRPNIPALPSADRNAGTGGVALDATRNDPAAIFESIFGPGEVSPVNVSDPTQPWIDPLRRFYYPGQPTPIQGLGR